jgi:hypothetical protein
VSTQQPSRWRAVRHRLAVVVLLGAAVLAVQQIQGAAHEVTLTLMLTDVDYRTTVDGQREFMTREKMSRLEVVLYTGDGDSILRSQFGFEKAAGRVGAPFAVSTGEVTLPEGAYRLEATMQFRASSGEQVTRRVERSVTVEREGRIDVRL